MTVPTAVFELQEKVAKLQEAILNLYPTMPILLRQIHTQLRADAELVTTLSENEIGILVNGLKLQTNTEIVTTVAKVSAPSLKKQLKGGGGGGSAADMF